LSVVQTNSFSILWQSSCNRLIEWSPSPDYFLFTKSFVVFKKMPLSEKSKLLKKLQYELKMSEYQEVSAKNIQRIITNEIARLKVCRSTTTVHSFLPYYMSSLFLFFRLKERKLKLRSFLLRWKKVLILRFVDGQLTFHFFHFSLNPQFLTFRWMMKVRLILDLIIKFRGKLRKILTFSQIRKVSISLRIR